MVTVIAMMLALLTLDSRVKRYSLKLLFVVLTAAGLLAGFWAMRVRKTKTVVAQLAATGATVRYTGSPVIGRFCEIVGLQAPDDPFASISVSLDDKSHDDQVAELLMDLPNLRGLHCWDNRVSHSCLQRIRKAHPHVDIVSCVPLDLLHQTPTRILYLQRGMTWSQVWQTLHMEDYRPYLFAEGGGQLHGGPRVRTTVPMRSKGFGIQFTFNETTRDPQLIEWRLEAWGRHSGLTGPRSPDVSHNK